MSDEFDDEVFDDEDFEDTELESVELTYVAHAATDDDSDIEATAVELEQIMEAEQATQTPATTEDYLDVVSTDSALALFALPTTGEARVDDALGRLADLESLPVHEHVEVFEDVQRRLHDTLADLAGS